MIFHQKAIQYKYSDLVNGVDYIAMNYDPETGTKNYQWKTDKYPEPTEEELAQWEAEADVARNRRNAYPPIEEQLDYIYHNGIDAWKTNIILPIKTKYPKPI